MANVLLVDSDEVAQRAMKGFLLRGDHRFAAASSAHEAWEFIRQVVKVDAVICELRLKGDDGLTLIQRLKNDPFFRALPVIVYTAHADKESVKQVLSLRVQNFLLKPYREEALLPEIGKAVADPWIDQLFVSDKEICAKHNVGIDRVRAKKEELVSLLGKVKEMLADLAKREKSKEASEVLHKLGGRASLLGARGLLRALKILDTKALAGDWGDFEKALDLLSLGARLTELNLNPDSIPEAFLTEEEINSEKEGEARERWATAHREGRCPMVGWDQLKRELDKLTSCPIVDSIAAAYQMAANGHPTSLSPLLDLVRKDPGLTAEILASANRMKRSEDDGDPGILEEPRMAIGWLGENRLAALGGNLVTVEERLIRVPPLFNWPNFRLFQLGTAHMARFVCEHLEMASFSVSAYTAGMIHDLGKLLLMRLHPFAFPAIHEHAIREGLTLAKAERHFLEVSTYEMAAYFAEKQDLPRQYVNVFRWMEKPEEAPVDSDLVAVVSLARDLCRRNEVGFNGDTPEDDATPLEETSEWQVLKNRVYLNFDLKRFEKQAHKECLAIRRELRGLFSR
ncbi:response regulator [Pelagicoccus sp. SDUM812003]|uniref:response regulator n=1 Tax=Pelagicoccus sp. SDUM812003 TaxID=3041267 RepID=UPI00280D66CE|nr:response regulator [Pelagicoccus sp. SDUM812003]MDQ8201770.1 response regulator [Pelagicoccus sp. SDUM812003]